MKFLNKLERRFGKYAIPNLMVYIIALYGLGFVINWVEPYFYWNYLSLNAKAVLQGQVWRIVTFLIQPPSTNIIWMLIASYMYYMIGGNLERVWGTFRFNLYIFTGILGHVLAALLIYMITRQSYPLTTTYLNFSLFFAFAMTYPEMQFLIMFIIPVKAKYLAYVEAAFFAFSIFMGIVNKDWATVVSIVLSMANVIVFTMATRNYKRVSPSEIRRKRSYQKQVRVPHGVTRHKCAVCGKTERDGDDLQFRFCSKCNGNYEYCQDHLFTHTHVQ